MITRRGLFGVLAGVVAAPIVVRSGLLMPVKAVPIDLMALLQAKMDAATAVLTRSLTQNLYSDTATPYAGGLASLIQGPAPVVVGPVARYEFKQVWQSVTLKAAHG